MASPRLRISKLLTGLRLAYCAALVSAAPLLGTGCGPQMPPPAAAQEAPARDEQAWAALERVERRGNAEPDASATELAAIAQHAAPDSDERLEAIVLQLNLAAHEHDPERAERLLSALESWPAGHREKSAQLAAAYGRAALLREQGDLKAARKALLDLGSMADPSVPPTLLIRAYLMLGYSECETSAVDRAIAHGAEALRISERLASKWRHADTLNDVSWFHFRAQQVSLAKVFNAEALAEAQQDPAPTLLFHIYNNRSIYYEEDMQIAPAMDAQALKYARISGDPALLAQAVGNSADAFLRQHQFAQALQLATEGLKLSLTSHNAEDEIVARANVGLAKIGLHRVEEGKAEVKVAIAMFESRGAARSAAELWEEFGNALEAAGDAAGAVEAFHTYRRQFDPLMQDETRKAIVEEQERAEDERRDREVDLLNRENSLKAEQLRTHELLVRLWAALAGCIVVSGALLTLAYRRVRRTNRALATTNASLKVQSEQDSLTGLANRRFLQTAIRRLATKGKFTGTIFLIDIDHFKRINDQYGHAAGDAVLVEVSRRLRGVSREGDLLVRWGGEEFVFVVASQDGAAARALAQRLLDQLSEPEVVNGTQRIAVTASIGFATFPLAPHALELNWERAVDLVDTLMYMAKAHGRNRAYGLDSIDAHSELELQNLSLRLESAWQEGRATVATLHGPSRERSRTP